MNKSIYCESNQGTFDVKKFIDPKLYPIINDKITLQTTHPFFKSVEGEIENLTLQLFKGMSVVFKEIAFMKGNVGQREKYQRVFGLL